MARDLHFKVEGPAVAQLQEAFRTDWHFTCGQWLDEKWFPRIYRVGHTAVRGISDGPDHDFEKGRWTILGALGLAQKSIQIVTPYFVPDGILISELGLAALKGVRVDIILPALNDLPIVHWASRATLWQVLERGCHVWFSPAPFDHSKIMTVDRGWALVGSSNWDTRSFRLNFEFNMECYDQTLASELANIVDEKMAGSHEVTLAEMDSRGVPVKIRDGVARLFAPHL
jgi:cardiolipin synthase